MRGHAVPSSCPRCRQPSLPSPDQRLIDCPKCGLGYDWIRQADTTTQENRRRGEPPSLSSPADLDAREQGGTLVLLLPNTRVSGGAMIVVALCCVGTAVAMFLASNPWFAAALLGMALMFLVMGINDAFSRRRITVTPTELRVDQTRFGGTRTALPLSDLTQLAIARTRRGRKQLIPDFELWAQGSGVDTLLLSTRDENLARYLEQRIEYQLAIVDDGVDLVLPGSA